MTTTTDCRRHSLYLIVQGYRYGVEIESRVRPRYVEIRLLTPGRVRLWTHRAGDRTVAV